MHILHSFRAAESSNNCRICFVAGVKLVFDIVVLCANDVVLVLDVGQFNCIFALDLELVSCDWIVKGIGT